MADVRTVNFVNQTKHAIHLRLADGAEVTFEPSGQVAQVAMVETPAPDAGSFPAVTRVYGPVTIPAPQEIPGADGGDGVVPHFILVSSMVLEAAQQQGHPMLARLLVPDSGPSAVRWSRADADSGLCAGVSVGQIRAVVRFVRA